MNITKKYRLRVGFRGGLVSLFSLYISSLCLLSVSLFLAAFPLRTHDTNRSKGLLASWLNAKPIFLAHSRMDIGHMAVAQLET